MKDLSPIWGLTQTANFTLVLQYIKCLINSKVRDKPVHVYQVKVISATVNDCVGKMGHLLRLQCVSHQVFVKISISEHIYKYN